MARVKLQLPAQPIFTTNIAVRISDINYGNHLGNDAVVSMAHEARMQWLTSLGYSELNIEGVGVIMSDLAVEYKNESFYGDTISVQLFIGDITAVSFELYYLFVNQHNKEIGRLKTGMVCYNYEVKKVWALPAGFLNKLNPAL